MNKKDDNTNPDKSPERKQENKDGGNHIRTRFDQFAAFLDGEGSGSITLKNIQVWLKQAEFLNDEDGISEAETVKAFEKIAKGKQRISFNEFEEFIETISGIMNINEKELIKKLILTTEPVARSSLPAAGKGVHYSAIHKDKDMEDLGCTKKCVPECKDHVEEEKDK